MKTQLKSICLLSALLLGANTGSLQAQVTPLTCGAISTNAGSKLLFVNGAGFSPNAGFAQPLTYQRIANRYGTNVYYTGTNLLFQALSVQTNWDTSAGYGAYLVCEVVSVTGPAGAKFSFWEQGAGWPTFEFPVGGTYAPEKSRFILGNCETDAGSPGGDPFGSISGRRFAADKMGDYLVTFKLYDVSANHPSLVATPVHAASDPITVKFSTKIDLNITQFSQTNDVAKLVYSQGLLTNVVLEAATNLQAAEWAVVAGPFTNTPTLTTNVFTNISSLPAMFYRLRGVAP